MRSIEVEGEDIDQAIAQALRALQVERERVEVEILSAATRGVLGFGGRKARIRATVRPPLESTGDGGETPPAASGTTRAGAEVPREPSRRPAMSERPRPEAVTRTPTAGGSASNAVSVRAQRFLEDLLQQIGTTCSVAAHDDETGAVVLTVSGPETALVIGRRGQTLDAIEYVVNRVASRDEEPAGTPRFVVDAEGYRGRRREYLEELATRLCEKVGKTGRAVTLNPMTPRDRRTVHLTVQKHAGVTSRSHGEGHLRSMMILPEGDDRRPARGSGRVAD